ncbi:MAG: ABC transporter substrate-binding protein [Agrobacterium sp. SCN 61-19]|nr:MAG: ABC transporter substrate-binding protein [Agrobacterium sp. SCN 61-19]
MRIKLHHLAPLAAILLSVSDSTLVAAEEARFPLEISHALGQTTVPQKPKRVATVAWANHEVPLALGIVPVGMAAANFGDDDGDGLLPWVSERLKSLGADAPVLFDEGDGIDFEAVAGTAPDVILAAYSGLSRSDYDTLSQIAPVIAYPQAPWSTDWRETIRFDSAGMGMAPDGEALIADIEQKIAAEVAKYPELKGKRAMFVTHLDATDLSIVNFYTTQDTRVRFFADLGLSMPKSVMQASTTGSFAGSISAEQIDLFDDVDILVTYGDQALIDAMKANPLLSHMPAVKHDAIVTLGRDPVGTAANPTPLSITWVLPAYVEKLADAARKTE